MELMPLLLSAVWFWAVFAFARWRCGVLTDGQERCPSVLNDWAVQLFLKGSGLVLLLLILLCLAYCC